MSVFASLKQFDAYSKPVEDFRERTVTGKFFFETKKSQGKAFLTSDVLDFCSLIMQTFCYHISWDKEKN